MVSAPDRSVALVRVAGPGDLARFAAIERDAARRFAEVGLAELAEPSPPAAWAGDVAAGRGLVADTPLGAVGFLVWTPVDEPGGDQGALLRLVAVREPAGRTGIGQRLVAAFLDAARAAGCVEAVLTTCRDVPWNGPFYRRLGFREIEPGATRPLLAASRAHEGLAMPGANRIAMAFDLRLARAVRPGPAATST